MYRHLSDLTILDFQSTLPQFFPANLFVLKQSGCNHNGNNLFFCNDGKLLNGKYKLSFQANRGSLTQKNVKAIFAEKAAKST